MQRSIRTAATMTITLTKTGQRSCGLRVDGWWFGYLNLSFSRWNGCFLNTASTSPFSPRADASDTSMEIICFYSQKIICVRIFWCIYPGKTHYNFFQLKYQFISSIWHDYLTRISQISQNHTSLSLVCSRPDGKREWNDAFSRDLRDSRETKKLRETGIFL